MEKRNKTKGVELKIYNKKNKQLAKKMMKCWGEYLNYQSQEWKIEHW